MDVLSFAVSPILWLLVANVSLKRLENRGLKIVAYDDEVVILIGGQFLSTLGELYPLELRTMSVYKFRLDRPRFVFA